MGFEILRVAVEGCDFFVTVDERHMLWEELRDAMRDCIEILGSAEAVARV